MPIKFRCQHCRQFLGISRSKAGEVFDCPTCGWTLRVPDLDGTIRPLPDGGLDMGDSKLAQALDELASIDDPSRGESLRSAAQSAGGTGVEGRVIDDRKGDESYDGASQKGELPKQQGELESSPQPIAGIRTLDEPIDLPPLSAPEPIDLAPRVRGRKPISPGPDEGESDSSGEARPWRSTAQAGKSWKRLLAAAEFGLTEGDSTDEPVKEADPVSERGSSSAAFAISLPTSPDAQGPTVFHLSKSLVWAVAGIIAVVFAGGFWVGRITTLPVTSDASATPTADLSTSSATESGEAESGAVVVENADGRYVAFRGRITYRTEDGDRKADRGARVIVLPVERKGTVKLSVTGLRTGDQEDDQQFAATGIRTLGGDVSTASDSGEFEIKLPGSGQFYILAISNSVSRDEAVDATKVEEALASYFERPTQLLGRVMHHFEEVRYSGDGVTPWDYSFSQP
ncbi:MAG: hypothetical protein ACI8P0_005163 [Planctomycetaceae bacterium]|jgi:hypothetical protein